MFFLKKLTFFPPENMKKPPSKVAHNRPRPFFSVRTANQYFSIVTLFSSAVFKYFDINNQKNNETPQVKLTTTDAHRVAKALLLI